MKFFGMVLTGLRGQIVQVKCTLQKKAVGTIFSGLAQTVVKEGWTRAKGAIEQSGLMPIGRAGLTFDLSPSEIPKNDPTLDLSLAIVGLLARAQQELEEVTEPDDDATDREWEEYEENLEQYKQVLKIHSKMLTHAEKDKSSYFLIGNLDPTSGELRRAQGGILSRLLSIEAEMAKKRFADVVNIILPTECSLEAQFILDKVKANIFVADSLSSVYEHVLLGEPGKRLKKKKISKEVLQTSDHIPDFKDIRGLATAKECAEIATAGGHHMLLYGEKGIGKSTLANAIGGLLPRLSPQEFFDVNRIWDSVGKLDGNSVIFQRPFQVVNRTTTSASLLGGGHKHPQAGIISLAHCGVLLIEELIELNPLILDQLRDPLEKGNIIISRGGFTEKFPCNFYLVATMNPCKCSSWGIYQCGRCDIRLDGKWCHNCLTEDKVIHQCRCNPRQVAKYRDRLSGPILDRIDLKVRITNSDTEKFSKVRSSLFSKERIANALQMQGERYKSIKNIIRNGRLASFTILEIYRILGGNDPSDKLKTHINSIAHEYSPRVEAKIIAVSRTIADLEGLSSIQKIHIDHAFEVMGLQDEYWNSDFQMKSTKNNSISIKIARAVAGAKRQTGYNIVQLAEKANVHPSVVRKALTGKYNSATDSVKTLLKYVTLKINKP